METSTIRRWLAGLSALAVLATLAACSVSPPKSLEESANGLPEAIEQAREANKTAKSDYAEQLEQPEYSFMLDYSEEEQHADYFGRASNTLDEAQGIYDDTIKPLLDDYEETKQGDLEDAVESAAALVEEAKVYTADPALWADKVVTTKADPDGTVASAASTLEDLNAAYTPLEADVAVAKETYSNNAAAIDEKFQPFVDWHSGATEANEQLASEAGNGSPNYAVMTTHATTVATSASAFHEKTPELEAQLADLDVRETHTLVDIQVISLIYIWRTSWCESCEYSSENDYSYDPVEISDQEVVEHFAQFGPDDVLARDSDGWLSDGFETDKVDKKQWDKLGIDPRNPEWESGDGNAEFYLDEIEDIYCNKMYVLRNGQPDTSDRPNPEDNYCSKLDTSEDLANGIYWIEVDELDAESIGMDVFVKDYGQFADQALMEATPPGMLYVDDSSTGAWATDANGNEYWQFNDAATWFLFGMLIGGTDPWHYRSEYNTWNSDYRYQNKPYYAGRENEPRYGMYAPLVSSRFADSYYYSNNVYGTSVRGAGPWSRGGGPGGGGK